MVDVYMFIWYLFLVFFLEEVVKCWVFCMFFVIVVFYYVRVGVVVFVLCISFSRSGVRSALEWMVGRRDLGRRGGVPVAVSRCSDGVRGWRVRGWGVCLALDKVGYDRFLGMYRVL